MGVARVTSNYQVTIPADIRDAFQVSPGDELEFYGQTGGTLGVRVRHHVQQEIAGVLGALGMDDAELDAAVDNAASSGALERAG